MKAGVYLDLSAEEYAAIPALRSTFLRAMLQTTPHKAFTQEARPDSDALAFGRLLHACVLEPERFERELAVMPEFKGVGSRAMQSEWILRNAGKIQVKPKVLEQLLAMRDAVHASSAADMFSGEGRNEVSVIWDDPLGIRCKARFDRIYAGCAGVLCALDLKSTRSAQEDFFRYDVKQYGYDVEACFYARALEVVHGEYDRPFAFVAVEKVAPYRVEVYELKRAERILGTQKMLDAMKTYAQCMSMGHWPDSPIYGAFAVQHMEEVREALEASQ